MSMNFIKKIRDLSRPRSRSVAALCVAVTMVSIAVLMIPASPAEAASCSSVTTSPDGITWTERLAPQSSLVSVTYGNGKFVALDNGNNSMISPDGIHWTEYPINSVAGGKWYSIAYGNSTFVAVCQNCLSPAAMTSPDGITWTLRATPIPNPVSVAFGNGVFVTGRGRTVLTSPDGITWTSYTGPVGLTFGQVEFGNGTFVSSTGLVAAYSTTTGSTWNVSTYQQYAPSTYVAYGNGTWASIGAGFAWTSPNGAYWTQYSPEPSPGGSIGFLTAFGGTHFASIYGNTGAYSSNGSTWTATTPSNNPWQDLTYGGGLFVAVGGKANGVPCDGAPTLTTDAATNVTGTSATLNGSITATGNSDATQTGFARSTNATLTGVGVSTSTLGGFTGTGAFSAPVSALTTGTTYYYRAYATNGFGTGYGSIVSFVATTPAPTVTALSPTSGPAAGGTSVVITGTNFTGASVVKFGATNATAYTVNSATQITATSPAGSGVVDVLVTAPGGTSANTASDNFTYIAPAPTVTAINPTSGPNNASVSLTSITGTGFASGATISLQKTGQTSIFCTGVLFTNSTTLSGGSCPITNAATGAWDVVVTNADGQSGTLAGGFTVTYPIVGSFIVTSALPAGVSVSFSPASCTPPSASCTVATVQTSASTPAGSFTLTIQGTAAGVNKTASFTVNVVGSCVNGTGSAGGCTSCNPGYRLNGFAPPNSFCVVATGSISQGLLATPSRAHKGVATPVTFSWTVSSMTSCSINNGIGPVPATDGTDTYTTTITLSQSTTYTLSCTDGAIPSNTLTSSAAVGLVPVYQEI